MFGLEAAPWGMIFSFEAAGYGTVLAWYAAEWGSEAVPGGVYGIMSGLEDMLEEEPLTGVNDDG
jgi:hypothetical protein